MEWIPVKHRKSRKVIGAIGFVENEIAVVATFYADKDWNHEGRVSFFKENIGSFFSLRGKALVEVTTGAKYDTDIYMKDPKGIAELHSQALTQFGFGMIHEGIYLSYFKMGVAKSCGAIAGKLVRGTAAKFLLRKGMEKAVKEAYDASF